MNIESVSAKEDIADVNEEHHNGLYVVLSGVLREARMVGEGVVLAAGDTVDKLPQLGLSIAIGGALGALDAAGTPGKLIAAAIGTAMTGKVIYDEVTGGRWSQFGKATVDAWRPDAHMSEDIDAAKKSAGSLVVDTVTGAIAFGIGHKAVGAGLVPGVSPCPFRFARLFNYTAADLRNGEFKGAEILSHELPHAVEAEELQGAFTDKTGTAVVAAPREIDWTFPAQQAAKPYVTKIAETNSDWKIL